MKHIGLDAGNGGFKVWSNDGGLEVLSQVSTNGGQRVAATIGLKVMDPPMHIQNDTGAYYIGTGAHDYGRPVENLDTDRFTGTPEMVALWQGAMTKYQQRYGDFSEPLSLVIGLPQDTLSQDTVESTRENVRKWLKGQHTWRADGVEYALEVADVKIAAQVSGGLFDFLLDDGGKFVPERKRAFTGEIGVVSIGFGTVELMVVRDKAQVQRFTGAAASGVRRLLEIKNPQRLYSLGELDVKLRAGQLDVSAALPIWEREVMGAIERQWGTAWRRFDAVLIMGGGALLLKNTFPQRFNGKAWVSENPVMAISRGLYKMTLGQTK